MTTCSEWPFHDTYRVDLPPTQIKSAVERCKKKHIVDLSSLGEETLAVITQVHLAYSKKKERARAASSRSRAAKSAEEPAIDDVAEVAVEPEAAPDVGICEVVAEAEAVPPTPPAPEPTAAAPTKAAPKAAKSRADNVAPAHPARRPPRRHKKDRRPPRPLLVDEAGWRR